MSFPFLNTTNVMIDLETWSTKPTAAIMSIGAVKFSFQRGIFEEKLINVDINSCKQYNLHFEKETLNWWKNQDKVILQKMLSNAIDLNLALEQFTEFLGDTSKKFLWCLGASFDFPILKHAYFVLGKERPWNYWNELDLRTVHTLLSIRNKELRKNDRNYHSALDDAKEQAKHLIEVFREFSV